MYSVQQQLLATEEISHYFEVLKCVRILVCRRKTRVQTSYSAEPSKAGPVPEVLQDSAGRIESRVRGIADPVAPVAYQVILEPGIGQFREFEPRRVHTRINSLGLFLVHKFTWKARERELATLVKSRRAVGLLNPMRDKN